jgi:beta-fructofuranosidase
MHQMTCPRELRFATAGSGRPRRASWRRCVKMSSTGRGAPATRRTGRDALEFELSASQVNVDFGGALRLTVDEQGVRLERASLKTGETLTRYWQGDVRHLRVLCDRSSVEIFINHGEGVMSSRYFPDHPARVRFEGASDITLRYWSLRACMIE